VTTAHTLCPGFTATITAFGANSYTWTGSTPSFSNPVFQQSISAGPGGYTVVGSNGGSCISTDSIRIFQGPPIIIHASSSTGTTCIANNNPKYSKPVILTATGASYYSWAPYNPIYMTYSLGPTTTVRPPASTCYTVTGVTSVCSNSTSICVTVSPQFSMGVVPPLPAMCLGDSLKLSIINIEPYQNIPVGIGHGALGPQSAFTYSWTEAANAPPISMSNMLTQTVMVFPKNTTTYSVEVYDSRKCVSLPRLVTVTVLPRPITSIALPSINNVPTNTVCYVGLNPGPPDVVLTLTGNNENPDLQFGVVPTYTWVSPYPPKYNSILTPVNNNAITVSGPLRVPSVVVYTLISGYNGIPGCSRLDTVSVHVVDCRPVTSVSFATAEPIDTICVRNCVTFVNLTDTMAGGPQTFTWTFQGGAPLTSTVSTPLVCYNLPGKYNVILKVKNPYPMANGGSEKTIGELSYIKVVDVPNVTIIAPGNQKSDTTIRFGQTVSLHGSGGFTYDWSPNYNISSLTKPDVVVRPFRTTQYILTGYNSRMCSSSDTVNVIVIEDCGEMFVPNAFSPNGDGHNDVLKVNGICLQNLSFMIFNRWGEKVFETIDQETGWDGTYKGEAMNTGVYVYRLEGKTYDGKAFSGKGNITLIR
jgi:gliding motility-associated-like protein